MSLSVLFDHQAFDGQIFGGISRYITELSRALSKEQSCRVKVISPIYINQYLKNYRNEIQINGFPMLPIRGARRLASFINEAVSPRLIERESADILHVTGYRPSLANHGFRARVVSVYDMTFEKFPQYFGNAELASQQKRHAVTSADHIICISKSTQKDLIQEFGVDENRTSVVHLAASLTKHSLQRRSTEERPFFLHVGGRWGYKNFSSLLLAYRMSKSLQDAADIVCFGGEINYSSELKEIKKLGLSSERIRFIRGSDVDLSSLYQRAICLVYPSKYEGFGLPLLEAMSCGCPVMCSATSSMPEVCGDGAWYVDVDDADSIRLAMEKMLNCAEEREQLILAGNVRSGKFSWGRCAEETILAYEVALRKMDDPRIATL